MTLPPQVVSTDPDVAEIWDQAVTVSKAAYSQLLDKLEQGAAELTGAERKEYLRRVRSAARTVLPEGTETIVFVTANARAIRHFLTTRGAIEGDDEMRIVSALLLRAMNTEAPALFADFELGEKSGLPLVKRR